MAHAHHRPLLGMMADSGWFRRRAEVATTFAMSLLLREPVLREAFADWVSEQTGVDVTAARSFWAEAVNEDKGRVDLEGRDSELRPIVVVEAKFGATLSTGQIEGYLINQSRLLGSREGALVILVPHQRLSEAQSIVATATSAVHAPAISALAVTWDDWLDMWDRAAADEPADARSVAADLAQLRAMCQSFNSLSIEPFAAPAEWTARADDLRSLVAQVADRFTQPDSTRRKVWTKGAPLGEGLWVKVGTPHPETHFWIGIPRQGSWQGAEEPDTPLWMAYWRRTAGIEAIEPGLRATCADVRDRDGYLWIPLELPLESLVDRLEARVREIHALATAEAAAPVASGPMLSDG